MAIPMGDIYSYQLVIFPDIQGNDPVGAGAGIFLQGSLLYDPFFCDHHQKIIIEIVLISEILYL